MRISLAVCARAAALLLLADRTGVSGKLTLSSSSPGPGRARAWPGPGPGGARAQAGPDPSGTQFLNLCEP